MHPNWILIFLAVIGVKSIIFGQYWPWQYKGQCPHCGSPDAALRGEGEE